MLQDDGDEPLSMMELEENIRHYKRRLREIEDDGSYIGRAGKQAARQEYRIYEDRIEELETIIYDVILQTAIDKLTEL